MKKILLLLAVLASGLSHAQTVNDIGKISLSVILPESIEGLDGSNMKKLETKIVQIITASGLGSSSFNNNFIIYPAFIILDKSVVEGGMQNINVISAELSLYIKQYENNLLFASTSLQLKGSGNNDNLAISNAISKVNSSDNQFKQFIEEGKVKIIQYYIDNCQDIIIRAVNASRMQSYEEALGLLMTIPAEIPDCYNQSIEKAIVIYKDYQNYYCETQLQEAKAFIAGNYFSNALWTLIEVDPVSHCFKEATGLLKSIENKIDIEEKKQWDFMMKLYNNEQELEKLRINAIKEISVAYFNSQPKTINTNYIFR